MVLRELRARPRAASVILLILLLGALGITVVANRPAPQPMQGKVTAQPVATEVRRDELPSLAALEGSTLKPTRIGGDPMEEERRERLIPGPRNGPAHPHDPLLAASGLSAPTAASVPAPSTSFEGVGTGIGYGVQYAPPDTTMDVGKTQIVEAVNVGFAVWDKSTGVRTYGPVSTNTIWSGFGGLCQNSNDGDATVVYDRLADRWIVSQFALGNANGTSVPFLQCVAVSTTSNALGGWYRYAFSYTYFPDYPKLAVWPDAFYTTFNAFNAAGTSFLGARVCAYERAAMLAGTTARQVCYSTSSTYDSILVAGVEGTTPPSAGTQAYGISVSNPSANTLSLWRFGVTWGATPALTTTGPTNLPVSAFNLACNGTGGTCVPQSGTSTQLDTLGDRMMYRYVYRNFGDHEALVVGMTVANGSPTAIRWYELRPAGTGGDPAVFQQGTYAPDTNYRWMPSVSMDAAGNIAMVYSVSSSTLKPGIRIAGRLVDDTAGTLGQGETTVITGAGAQTGGLTRWGDYAAMAVDPVDDCTFWSATEYLPSNGSWNWNTRISAFSFPACGTAGPPRASVIAPASPTNAIGPTFSVRFNEPITGLAGGDFTPGGTASGCSIGSISGPTNNVYSVPVVGCGEGTLNLKLLANSVADASSNTGPTTDVTSGTITIDRTAPTVALTANVASDSTTNVSSITVTATFSEAPAAFDATDLSITGTSTGWTAAVTGTTATTATITLSGTTSSNGTLSVRIPSGSFTDLAGNASTTDSNTLNWTIRVLTLTSFTPASGAPGTAVTLAGRGYGVGVSCAFNNVTSPLCVPLTGSSLLTVVPAGATSGRITVTLGALTATSATNFTVGTGTALPTVTSVSPVAGLVGSVVTVNGSNVGAATSVSFNGGSTTLFTPLSASSLSVTVPAGAVSGVVRVTTIAGTSTSTVGFTVNDAPLQAAGGTSHSCVVITGGGVRCWGLNSSRQLGDGTTTQRTASVAVMTAANTPLTGASTGAGALATGGAFSCVVVSGGVTCWGLNSSGQLGNGSTTTPTYPVSVSGLTSVTAIAAGATHACALKSDGTVWCWGSNGSRQLGDGTTTTRSTPVQVRLSGTPTYLANATAIAAGGSETCAVISGGTVRCWGSNTSGQLGTGNTTAVTYPALVSGISNAANIAVGGSHACALLTTGGVSCWGLGTSGQLGRNSTASSSLPVTVLTSAGTAALSNATAVEANGNQSCAIVSGGALCWGANGSGQMGIGVTGNRLLPVTPTGLGSGVAAIGIGGTHIFVLPASGAVSFGANTNGQLGDGTTTSKSSPVSVIGF